MKVLKGEIKALGVTAESLWFYEAFKKKYHKGLFIRTQRRNINTTLKWLALAIDMVNID